MSSKRVPCIYPWLSLDIGYSGYAKVGCCEYKGKPFEISLDAIDIEEIWRNGWFRKLRQGFDGDGRHPEGCRGCAKLVSPAIFSPYPEWSAPQRMNFDDCHTDRDALVDIPEGVPARYSFCFTPRCNLDCIMCSQHDSRESSKVKELSADSLLRNRRALSRAAMILVSGGEPFVSRECVKFIEAMCLEDDFSSVALEIVSNGILLDKVLPTLEHKERLTQHVSLDGVGPVYEKIRKGGSWKRVSGNMERFLESRERLGRKHWNLTTSAVLMKSSLEGLADLVAWCVDRDIRVGFQALMPTRETYGEDVLGRPSLLEDIPGWEASLAKAIDTLDKAGWIDEQRNLEAYRDRLMTAKETEKVSTHVDYQAFSNEPARFSRKLAVWGTGSNYRFCWADWLREHVGEFDFVGFVDNDATRQGTLLDGYPVMSPEELVALAPDTVIVAAQIVWRDEIIEQMREVGLSDIQVV